MVAALLVPWQTSHARRPLAQEACAAMAEKYVALAALPDLTPGPAQDAALREAARRWPGCLREAQLAGPVRCRERLAHARAGAAGPERPRGRWLADVEDAAAVPLWADLHLLLADQLRWRARGGRGEAAGFVGSLEGDARGRWPDVDLLVAVAGPQVRPRQAYRWLAAQASLPLAGLNHALFGRAGPWDARPGDPPVSA